MAVSIQSQSFSQEMRQQANVALMKLDKGLRSKNVGEQSESIIRFSQLFDQFPFAIVINAAFLKLSDVYLEGNNFLRLCILRVVQESQTHLEKILNVEEFMKRVFSVMHSNDPIARALTLRMFGGLAPVVAERKNVHHSVRTGLESHDKLEQEAAIFAAVKLCKKSGVFSAGICNKVAEMIQGRGSCSTLLSASPLRAKRMASRQLLCKLLGLPLSPNTRRLHKSKGQRFLAASSSALGTAAPFQTRKITFAVASFVSRVPRMYCSVDLYPCPVGLLTETFGCSKSC
eukprot:m.87643 g.87643  ORF g.87643 m.87643 type:complete len:287 (+) comp36552_c2_seq1:637-1497(+)